LTTNSANFYFRSVCIKLVALRMNLYQEAALSSKKVGDPWLRQWLSNFYEPWPPSKDSQHLWPPANH